MINNNKKQCSPHLLGKNNPSFINVVVGCYSLVLNSNNNNLNMSLSISEQLNKVYTLNYMIDVLNIYKRCNLYKCIKGFLMLHIKGKFTIKGKLQ